MAGERLHERGGLTRRGNPPLAEIVKACEAADMPPRRDIFRLGMSEGRRGGAYAAKSPNDGGKGPPE